ncbi:MAG: hypothetical protein RMJ88_13435 [Thermogemmata sp.]|nr:hypothetical protein [Thermogemmata sp.]
MAMMVVAETRGPMSVTWVRIRVTAGIMGMDMQMSAMNVDVAVFPQSSNFTCLTPNSNRS